MIRRLPKTHFSEAFLKQLRTRVLRSIARLTGEVDTLAEEVLRPSGQDSGLENPADWGSDVFEAELSADVLGDRSDQLRDCREALDRLDGRGQYEYGLCESCADSPKGRCRTCPWIPMERLRYLPEARHCAAMQREIEAMRTAC